MLKRRRINWRREIELNGSVEVVFVNDMNAAHCTPPRKRTKEQEEVETEKVKRHKEWKQEWDVCVILLLPGTKYWLFNIRQKGMTEWTVGGPFNRKGKRRKCLVV